MIVNWWLAESAYTSMETSFRVGKDGRSFLRIPPNSLVSFQAIAGRGLTEGPIRIQVAYKNRRKPDLTVTIEGDSWQSPVTPLVAKTGFAQGRIDNSELVSGDWFRLLIQNVGKHSAEILHVQMWQ